MKALILFVFCLTVITACEASETKTAAEVREITPEVAKPLVEVANALFIDVRTAEEFASGRAKVLGIFHLIRSQQISASSTRNVRSISFAALEVDREWRPRYFPMLALRVR
jgi:hypothetical protein